jgi:hypothetical protein
MALELARGLSVIYSTANGQTAGSKIVDQLSGSPLSARR